MGAVKRVHHGRYRPVPLANGDAVPGELQLRSVMRGVTGWVFQGSLLWSGLLSGNCRVNSMASCNRRPTSTSESFGSRNQ